MVDASHWMEEFMGSVYSDAFYAEQQEGSIASADIVVPDVLRLFNVSSVVDFGCGVGGWLAAFQRHGVQDLLGIDGSYVPTARLQVRSDQFMAMDLTAIQPMSRKFDLACSLEVAEHLPERAADQLIAALVAAAPVVLFSAAVPFQPGLQHVNVQWQSYWAEKFEKHSYVAVDCIRPLIYGNHRVEWWYRQNTVIYCERDFIPSGHGAVSSRYELDRIDPAMVSQFAMPPTGGREAIARIRQSLPVLSRAVSQATRRFLSPR